MKNKMILIVGDDKKAMAQLLIASMNVPSGVSEVQLVPVGEWKGYRAEDEEGQPKLLEFKITEDVIAQMEKNFRGDVVLDYEHQTLTGDQAPAAGWIKKLVNKGKDGLWAVVEWTDKALEYIKNKEYRFLSPVFTLSGIDPRTGAQVGAMLLNAGLTNQPFFKELKPIVSKETFFLTQEDSTMNKLIARLREAYQLAADASEDAIIAKFNEELTNSAGTIAAKNKIIGVIGMKVEDTTEAVVAKLTAINGALSFKGEVITALGLKPEATLEEVKALVISGKNNSVQLAETVTKLADLEAKEFDREFDRIIAKAFFEGRIHPTQPKDAEWSKSQKDLFKAKGSDAYVEYWGKQPVIAPVGKLPTDVIAAKDGGLTEDEAKVANMVGVSAEIVKKHNKTN
jgi:phage I-like protein